MFRFRFTYPALAAHKQYLSRLKQTVQTLLVETQRETLNEVLDLLRFDAPPVHYPIQWTSERQRRAFFATDGFGRGIPTRRTDKINQWRYEVIGNALVIQNNADHLIYVRGTFRSIAPMQRFHMNTGWTPIMPLHDEVMQLLKRNFILRYALALRVLGQVQLRPS